MKVSSSEDLKMQLALLKCPKYSKENLEFEARINDRLCEGTRVIYIFVGDAKTGKSVLVNNLDENKIAIFDDFRIKGNDDEIKNIVAQLGERDSYYFDYVFVLNNDEKVNHLTDRLDLLEKTRVVFCTFENPFHFLTRKSGLEMKDRIVRIVEKGFDKAVFLLADNVNFYNEEARGCEPLTEDEFNYLKRIQYGKGAK